MLKKATLILFFTASTYGMTDCQMWVIKNWCRPAVDFKVWAIINNPATQCEVYAPTIADANVIAEQWVNGGVE